jgi:hypothetical protein
MVWPIPLPSIPENPFPTPLFQVSVEGRILYSLLGLAAYLVLASSLRFQRVRKIHRKYPYKTRASMGKMTDHDAFAIQKTIMQMEYPFIVLKALQFALFRV